MGSDRPKSTTKLRDRRRRSAPAQGNSAASLSRYELPEWFIKANVFSKERLDELHPPTRYVESPQLQRDIGKNSESGPEFDHATHLQSSQTIGSGSFVQYGSSSGNWLTSSDAFQELLDLTRDICHNYTETLPYRRHCSIALEFSPDMPEHLWLLVLTRLAQALNADLVNVDMADIEDLAWAFNIASGRYDWQELCSVQYERVGVKKACDDTRCTASYCEGVLEYSLRQPLADSYFIIGASWHHDQSSDLAVRSIVYGAIDALIFRHAAAQARPLLIHIRSASIHTREEKYLQAFRQAIEQHSPESRNVALIFSCSEMTLGELERCQSSLLVRRPTSFRPDPANQNGRREDEQLKAKQSVQKRYTLRLQTRELKRILLYRVPDDCDKSNCLPDTTWAIDDTLANFNAEDLDWSLDDTWKAAQAISGHVAHKGAVEMTDIEEVLSRAWRSKTSGAADIPSTVMPVEDPAGDEAMLAETNDGQSSATTAERMANTELVEPDSNESSAVMSGRLEAIRNGCSQQEVSLFDSVIDPETIQVTYDDIVMDGDTKAIIQQLVGLSQLKAEGRSQSLIDSVRMKGALFYGPPGTGKTHLSKAIAKQAQATMLILSAATVQQKYVGEGEKRISAAFSLARKLHPCVIFIDEVDALFYKRGSNDYSWERAMLTQFLQEMDGLSTSAESPLVIGATNHPSDLDDAFLRRLPQKILFRLPNLVERARILATLVHEDDTVPSVSLDSLASKTDGFSGSDLKSLCGQACMFWAMGASKSNEPTNKLMLTPEHFERALRYIRPTVSEESMKAIADFEQEFGVQPLSLGVAGETSSDDHGSLHKRCTCVRCLAMHRDIAGQIRKWDAGDKVRGRDIAAMFGSKRKRMPMPEI